MQESSAAVLEDRERTDVAVMNLTTSMPNLETLAGRAALLRKNIAEAEASIERTRHAIAGRKIALNRLEAQISALSGRDSLPDHTNAPRRQRD